ncbi:MAG: hypothetical protein ACO1PW_12040, partial [Actinomycetota bacterium]
MVRTTHEQSGPQTEDQPDAQHGQDEHQQGHSRMEGGMYLRFGAMILTSMVVMSFVMSVGAWELGHVRFSQSRIFMTLTMGGAMGLVMLGWMLHMYRSTK